jgi:hypothetical protein
VKRAIFRLHNIEQCIEHELFVTPIQPSTLPFTPGEQMLVATPRDQAAPKLGEYILAFTVGEYLDQRSGAGAELFGQPGWRHAYSITGTREIEPFSLDDVVAAAGPRGQEVRDRYRGQTQNHRIIRPVFDEDVALFTALLRPRRSTWSATETMRRNRETSERKQLEDLSDAEIVRRLRSMDRANGRVPRGKQYRQGRSQKRNARFTELLKALYDSRCQVCGCRLKGPDDTRRADVHHIVPRDGDASDRMGNAIVVCPNDHALFELGALRWANGLERWQGVAWRSVPRACDRHLLVRLSSLP